jgi:hypothetical protein
LRRLTSDWTLRDYFTFRPNEPRREEWFEAVRRVKSRQTDAEMLLKEQSLVSWPHETRWPDLYELWRFDLKVTPSLCEAFHQELRKDTAQIDQRLRPPAVFYIIWRQLKNINWLASANCDLSDTLTDIETKLRAVPPIGGTQDKQITDILNTLATLRQKH